MNSGISPRRALAYSPLRSRRSHSSSGVATCTSTNAPPASSTIARTCLRVASNGAIGLQMATPPCRLISAATQPIRRMFVSRSALEKVSPADRFRRTTSPSRLVTVRSPCSRTTSCRARASVDLPLPDRPVKNSTSPCSAGPGRSASTRSATASGSSPWPETPSTSPGAYAATTSCPSL